jgi:lactoylglutathione lyase
MGGSELLVNIDVDDVEAGVRFYTQVFGLRVGRRFGAGAVELLGGGAPIYLLAKPAGTPPFAGAASARDYGRHWTPVHLDFAVDDIEAAVAVAESAGARREGAIRDQVWGRLVLMSDPFGHGFCLLQWKGRGYDELIEG